MKLTTIFTIIIFISACNNNQMHYEGELVSLDDDGTELYLITNSKGEKFAYVQNPSNNRQALRTSEEFEDPKSKFKFNSAGGVKTGSLKSLALISELDTSDHSHKRWHINGLIGSQTYKSQEYKFIGIEDSTAYYTDYVVCKSNIYDQFLQNEANNVDSYLHFYTEYEEQAANYFTAVIEDVYHPNSRVLAIDTIFNNFIDSVSFKLVKSITSNGLHFHYVNNELTRHILSNENSNVIYD